MSGYSHEDEENPEKKDTVLIPFYGFAQVARSTGTFTIKK